MTFSYSHYINCTILCNEHKCLNVKLPRLLFCGSGNSLLLDGVRLLEVLSSAKPGDDLKKTLLPHFSEFNTSLCVTSLLLQLSHVRLQFQKSM